MAGTFSFWVRVAFVAVALVAVVLYGALAHALTGTVRHVRAVVARTMAGPVCRAARIRVSLEGLEHLHDLHAAVITPNQQSLLCYPVLANLYLRLRSAAVVARFTGDWDLPLAPWLFRRTGNMTVEPNSAAANARSLRAAAAALRAGTSIFIFPEGTRWKTPGQLGPFHRGAFRLAVEAGVPILPVVVSPLPPNTDLDRHRVDPNHVTVRVLPPVPTAGLTPADQRRLRDDVRLQMQAALDELALAALPSA